MRDATVAGAMAFVEEPCAGNVVVCAITMRYDKESETNSHQFAGVSALYNAKSVVRTKKERDMSNEPFVCFRIASLRRKINRLVTRARDHRLYFAF